MFLTGIGEVLTPIEDPCEYDAAWRSSLASYLFSAGVRSKDDFMCLRNEGGIMVAQQARSKRAGRKNAQKHAAAKVMRPVAPFNEHPECRSLTLDEWVQKMVFMMGEEAAGLQVSEDYRPIKTAMRWHEQDDSETAMKNRLEPLLLTDASLEVITLDLMGSLQYSSSIKAYERLFFCSRNDDFSLHPSIQRIQRLAMPWGPMRFCFGETKGSGDGAVEGNGCPRAKASDLWRALAANLGYDVLINMWGWKSRAHGLKDNSLKGTVESFRTVVTFMANNMLESLCTGAIGHKDASKMFSTLTALLKLLESRSKINIIEDMTKKIMGLTKSFMGVLNCAVPSIIRPEDGSINTEMIKAKLAAQQAIGRQPIEDDGEDKYREVMDKLMADSFGGEDGNGSVSDPFINSVSSE